jgi:sulfofructose kinase
MMAAGPGRRVHVLCVGSANIDHVFEVDTLPSGEGKQSARSARWGGGGIAATAAASISRLGGQATWCGLIGDDWLGQMLQDMFQELGVALCGKSIVPGATTPSASVFINPAGERWLGYHRGEGLSVEQSPPELPDMSTVDAVVTTCSDDSLTRGAMEQAKGRGIPRVLDAESGTMRQITPAALLADHVIFAEAGLTSYTEITDVERALEVADRRLAGRTIGVTLGPRGSAWKTDRGVEWAGAPRVKARDTTGCGDVFHGAYAMAIAEGADLHGAVRFATAVAALKARFGCSWRGMPSRPDVEKLIAKGWT